jgi:hypothetical protein
MYILFIVTGEQTYTRIQNSKSVLRTEICRLEQGSCVRCVVKIRRTAENSRNDICGGTSGLVTGFTVFSKTADKRNLAKFFFRVKRVGWNVRLRYECFAHEGQNWA